MDSMLAAVKAKRGMGQQDQGNPAMDLEGAAQEPSGSAMPDLIAQLSPEQKMELMELLAQDQAASQDVEKGGPASGERSEIAQRIAEEPEEESDEVAMSMLDRNSLSKAEAGAKPSGLGDRARMDAAKKLKSKGKMK